MTLEQFKKSNRNWSWALWAMSIWCWLNFVACGYWTINYTVETHFFWGGVFAVLGGVNFFVACSAHKEAMRAKKRANVQSWAEAASVL